MARELRYALRAALGRRCPQDEIFLLQNFADVEVLARWGDEPLRTTCLRAAREKRSGPAPYFAQVEIGNGPREPSKWGLVTRRGLVIQVATGERWVKLAAPLAPADTYEYLVEDLLGVAEELAPPAGGQGPDPLWPFRALRERTSPPRSNASETRSANPALGLVVEALESAGVFRDISSSTTGPAEESAVVVLTSRSPPRLLEARHLTTELHAGVDPDGVEVRLVVHELGWPKGTRRDARVLPGSWVTAWIGRSVELVERLPVGPREHRLHEEVMWLMTGDEILGGELTAFIDEVGRSLEDASRGPYR